MIAKEATMKPQQRTTVTLSNSEVELIKKGLEMLYISTLGFDKQIDGIFNKLIDAKNLTFEEV